MLATLYGICLLPFQGLLLLGATLVCKAAHLLGCHRIASDVWNGALDLISEV